MAFHGFPWLSRGPMPSSPPFPWADEDSAGGCGRVEDRPDIRRTACGSYSDVYDTMDSSGLTENLENHIWVIWTVNEPLDKHGQTYCRRLSLSSLDLLNNISCISCISFVRFYIQDIVVFLLFSRFLSFCLFLRHLLGWQEELPEHVCLPWVVRLLAGQKEQIRQTQQTQQKHNAEFLLHLFSKGFNRFCGLRGINF